VTYLYNFGTAYYSYRTVELSNFKIGALIDQKESYTKVRKSGQVNA